MAAPDPWIVTPGEKVKHEEQFKTLSLGTGMVSGDAAKKFFLQSRLPPQVLGVIWSLSDINGDGKLDLYEFSIACKLINLKLRGLNLPPSLPPQLKQSACNAPSAQPVLNSLIAGPIPGVPIAAPIPIQPKQPLVAAAAPAYPAMPAQPVAAPQPVVAPQTATLVKTNSQESGGSAASAGAEWGVPQASKLKFTQVFNAIDRNKTGFLSGVQARNILVQSKLPNPMLAQIWALSDVDGDGQLSCEEFVLALYLCELSKAGHTLPPSLPPHLIPPTQRRQSRSGSIVSTGSGTGGAAGSTGTPTEDFEDKRRENFSKGQAELERRRKALLDAQRRETEERLRREREEEAKKEKARQEAEKKRQEEMQAEMQRQKELQEQKEMEAKRLEEQKELARVDAEKQRQQEWEKARLQELMSVRQKQQESLMSLKAQNQSLTIELQTKDDRIKELTGKISETRCAVTEVKATIDGMRGTRDSHMQEMTSLKQQAKEQNQRLLIVNQERSQLKARSAAAAAAGGGEAPAIEAMVESKQLVVAQLKEKEEELNNQMKRQEEDFNNNIVTLKTVKEELRESVERAKMLYEQFIKKRNQVLTLREKLVNPDAAWGESEAVEATESLPTAAVTTAVGTCQQFRGLYQFDARNEDELSFMPGDIITVTSTEGADPGWFSGELNGMKGLFPEAYCEPLPDGEVVQHTPLHNIAEESITPSPRVLGTATALFPWSAQHNNQLAFNTGQRIVVRENQNGWMFGEVGDITGWFPSNFVSLEGNATPTLSTAPSPPDLPDYLAHDDISEFYTSNYAYDSTEAGDLCFGASALILVVRREGDWWVGVTDTGTGVFPSNFVTRAPQQLSGAPAEEVVEAQAASAVVEAAPQPVTSDVEAASDAEAAAEVAATLARAAQTEQKKRSRRSHSSSSIFSEKGDESDTEGREVSELLKSPRSPKTKGGKKPEIAMVLAPYDATSSNQLSMQRGQLVMIRKKTASGWWEGELQTKGKKRQIGWFPASYVKPLGGGSASARSTPVFQEATNILDAPPTSADAETVKSPSNGVKKEEAPVVAPVKTVERVEALYPYTAVNPDELTFEAGDIITVVDKEDAAWWKGELKGVEGVFPSNYVQPCATSSGAAPAADSFAAQVSQIAAQAADFGVDLDEDNLC